MDAGCFTTSCYFDELGRAFGSWHQVHSVEIAARGWKIMVWTRMWRLFPREHLVGEVGHPRSNAWGTSTFLLEQMAVPFPSNLSARPSSGESGTRPSTAGSDRANDPLQQLGDQILALRQLQAHIHPVKCRLCHCVLVVPKQGLGVHSCLVLRKLQLKFSWRGS
ncbi:hypothetical protein MLD38_039429 [Melastoma candidum]|uniref:Uncharacterized protein n=1 Tax=Melastoma candidum TaxID=119954 RepID=A0ACB9L349_9MYRT|nr:hypothetical protein MLD38_039429 [Melastoma candidum]